MNRILPQHVLDACDLADAELAKRPLPPQEALDKLDALGKNITLDQLREINDKYDLFPNFHALMAYMVVRGANLTKTEEEYFSLHKCELVGKKYKEKQ